jgi:hypothetical protein
LDLISSTVARNVFSVFEPYHAFDGPGHFYKNATVVPEKNKQYLDNLMDCSFLKSPDFGRQLWAWARIQSEPEPNDFAQPPIDCVYKHKTYAEIHGAKKETTRIKYRYSVKKACLASPVRVVKLVRFKNDLMHISPELLKKAKIVNIIRHPSDLTRSHRKSAWGNLNRKKSNNVTASLIYHEEFVCNQLLEITAYLDKVVPVDQLHRIRYEDFVHHPAAVWKKVMEFTGTTFTPEEVEAKRASIMKQSHSIGHLSIGGKSYDLPPSQTNKAFLEGKNYDLASKCAKVMQTFYPDMHTSR